MRHASKLAKARLRDTLCGEPYIDNELNRELVGRLKSNSLMHEAYLELERSLKGKTGNNARKQLRDFFKIWKLTDFGPIYSSACESEENLMPTQKP